MKGNKWADFTNKYAPRPKSKQNEISFNVANEPEFMKPPIYGGINLNKINIDTDIQEPNFLRNTSKTPLNQQNMIYLYGNEKPNKDHSARDDIS